MDHSYDQLSSPEVSQEFLKPIYNSVHQSNKNVNFCLVLFSHFSSSSAHFIHSVALSITSLQVSPRNMSRFTFFYVILCWSASWLLSQSPQLQQEGTLAVTSETTPSLRTFTPSLPVLTVIHEPLVVHSEPVKKAFIFLVLESRDSQEFLTSLFWGHGVHKRILYAGILLCIHQVTFLHLPIWLRVDMFEKKSQI